MLKVRTLDLKGGYRCYYVYDRDLTSVSELTWPVEEYGDPVLLAAVPTICTDYEPIVGMTPEEATRYAKEHADMFGVHGAMCQIIRNGLIRRLDGSWDKDGTWIMHGEFPTMEDEEDDEH